jgi:hypothetical protein
MTVDQAFLIANFGIMVFWALLIVLPMHAITQRLVHAPILPLALAFAYLAYAVPGFFPGNSPPGGGFSSLEAVMILFTSKNAVMAGWIHYLVFDLFVGAWEVRDSRRVGIAHWMVVPCLLLTLLLGPVGLMLYLLIRYFYARRWSLVETALPGQRA